MLLAQQHVVKVIVLDNFVAQVEKEISNLDNDMIAHNIIIVSIINIKLVEEIIKEALFNYVSHNLALIYVNNLVTYVKEQCSKGSNMWVLQFLQWLIH